MPKTVSQADRRQNLDAPLDLFPLKGNEAPSNEEPAALSKESTTIKAEQVTGNERPALKERQPTERTSWERTGSSEEPATPAILPKLVTRKETDARPVLRGATLHLNGLVVWRRAVAQEFKNERQIGRLRAESRGPVTSSPLKPRAPPAADPYDDEDGDDDDDDEDEDMSDDVQEAAESELDEAHGHNEEIPKQSGEQVSTLESLKRTLQQLQKENERLQAAVDDDNNLNEETVSILQSLLKDEATRSLGYPDDGSDMSSHLTLFAPGNLQLTARTETKVIKARTKIIHLLILEAPSPWLPDAFSCAFEVVVDAENAQVEHVELKEVMSRARRTKKTKIEIFKWVNDRLENPLHRLDVGGLIWGIGRWFNAAVERARVFQWLDIKYNRPSSDEGHQNEDDRDQQLTRDRAIELARYLDMTQNAAVDAEMTVTAGGRNFRKKVMLSWTIDLDWAGGSVSSIQVSVSGVPQKAEPGLRTIFSSLIPTLGVKGAFENIWTLIHGDSDEFKYVSALKGKKKG
ncbi:hypothetical protein AYL99_02183 [Fonsecaea erecta]|uniref:Uncharacterized protein n=1 Tax=Fonsecaea erecta TaxID=1367422 RepID=A0A178ZTY4_9EURO|nr:hypothetical protein AYL99_02183 [Fonsecaea erecta]OAP62956.1 hypothetical protein AYL99_02183 [Fonsecaea erecta]